VDVIAEAIDEVPFRENPSQNPKNQTRLRGSDGFPKFSQTFEVIR
jgi:hypothetical protein